VKLFRDLIFGVAGGLFMWVAAIVFMNRLAPPDDLSAAAIFGTPSESVIPASGFRVTSWNVGYAGMGKEADFVMDGGTQTRPESADLVARNALHIAQYLADNPADVFLLQETAAPSSNNYRYDLNQRITAALPGYQHTYDADARTRLIPPPLNLSVGNMILSRFAATGAETRGLPLEPTFVYGLFRKTYAMQVMRFHDDQDKKWVFVNVHLSAFDSARNHVRERQLREVFNFAVSEYDLGAHVIVGGDWNLRLSPDTRAHTTPDEFLFWIRDMPRGATPTGWGWAVDPSQPTVRTAYKPYVEGENATFIIDGFLYSPNVEPLAVSTADLGFDYTDHHPVTMDVRARPE